ncbi:TPA: hypothetical protein DIS56_02330 [Candidatus Saccharibacteria bacterium]|nr:MAG: hypothetical protein UX30_C0007G0091 [Candidatus Saccharibacteria bacterium GW2011_GWA2_46_10]OGL35584.1 MAG: hypothetical protein A3F05_00670 [Candidatus Saccharibacteria bacterium RIFCSPHIGHO2_12_FULL_47_17]HCM51948.1 hypothetical protein [Candidatus Saccharibacteria bacterium]
MIFRKISSVEPVVDHLAQSISKHLEKGGEVLWLLSGGSFIPVQVEVAKQLNGTNLSGLTVTLTDERYGPVGHPDSNWQKLLNAGFSLSGAQLRPVLENKDLVQTTGDFTAYLKSEFANSDYKIACIGIGTDGHVLGVKAESAGVNSPEVAISYRAEDFERITMTLAALKLLNEAVVYMVGDDKHELIRQIAEEDVEPIQQPGQAIKTVKKVTVYNDYKGEAV